MNQFARIAVAASLVGAAACGGDDVSTASSLLVTQGGSTVLTLAVIEGGAPIAIGVSLDGAPAGPVVVALAASPAITLDRTTLTFTATDYDRPQPVVIAPTDDADVIDDAGDLALSAPGFERLLLPIAIADDDQVGLVGLPAELLLMEGGSTRFELALATDPGGPITIAIAATDPSGATAQPATLTFGADWATPQEVTVVGPDDADDLDEAIGIELSGLHVARADVPVTVLDDERQNLVIAPGALALTESGAVGTFTVRLTQPPTGALAIAVALAHPAIAAASPTTLTFSPVDYATPQRVTLTPRADIDGAADASTVRLTAAGLRDRAVALTVAEDAVVDAPAIGGDFLMSIRGGFAPEGPPLRYRVTYAVDPVTAALSYSATALRVDDAQPIGAPVTATGAALGEDASFVGPFAGELPGEANPFSGTTGVVDAMKLGRVVDADRLCGTMTGAIGALPLDGSTWGAVRIIGSTLPAPSFACP